MFRRVCDQLTPREAAVDVCRPDMSVVSIELEVVHTNTEQYILARQR